MKYNEYKSPEGKVLFNLENFTYGHTILSAHNLNLIVLDEDEAKKLYDEYKAEEDRIMKAENSVIEEQSTSFVDKARSNVATMSLNDDGEYEEVSEEISDNSLEEFKKNKIAYLLSKGVPFNVDIQKIEH